MPIALEGRDNRKTPMPDPHRLRLSGDCGLRAIRALHASVSAALAASADVEIDGTDCERVDVSFVQLMTSAARTAERTGARLHLTNMPDAAQMAFARAGLVPPGA